MSLDASDEHWSVRAACRTGDPDGWTEVKPNLSAANLAAVTVCRTVCPVREQCAADGQTRTRTDRAGQIIGGVPHKSDGDAYPEDRIVAWLNSATAVPAAPPKRRPKGSMAKPKAKAKQPTKRKPVATIGRPVKYPCGTYPAYRRHRKAGQQPCEPCQRAREDRRAARVLRPCGTPAAFERHVRRNEEPCEPCREARRAKNRQWYAKHRAVAPPPPPPLRLVPVDALLPHGTPSARKRHLAHGEEPCEPCLAASTAQRAEAVAC